MENILSLTREFAKTKLSCGKNLIEITAYNNISFWWFIDVLFYNHLKQVSSQKEKTLQNFDTLLKVYRHVGISLNLIYDLTLKLIQSLLITLMPNKARFSKGAETILLLSRDMYWGASNATSRNDNPKTDSFYAEIITDLIGKYNYNICSTYFIDQSPIRGLKIFADKILNWNIKYTPINIYWSYDVWRKEVLAYNHFRDLWNQIKDDPILQGMCESIGLYNRNQILKELEFFFLVIFPFEVKYMEMAKKAIKKHDPKLLVLINEYGWQERALLVTALSNHIPVLAVQHGVIHDKHKGYMYAKDEISKTGEINSPYCPIPNITALYGEYHFNLLVERSGYNPKQLAVTGQPRYDIIARFNKNTRERFLDRHGIPSDKKIVLWTTQSHGMQLEENRTNLEVVCSTIKEINNVTLVIKQHPGEKKFHTTLIMDYLKKYDINGFILPKDANTLEAIYCSDIVIIKSSTTGMETIAMGKPLIVLNLSVNGDEVNYVEEGVAIGIYQKEDLLPTLKNVLLGNLCPSVNREAYISKYLYRIDGKSADRVSALIDEMVKSNFEFKRSP